MRTLLVCFIVIALSSSAALGLINVPSDGSDGAFNPAASVEVDLSQAVTGTWNQAGTGVGVYDPEKWAVVFKFSSVNIPEGVTVTFKNHPSRAPVVWLVQGNATIAGTVSLNGQPYVGGGSQRNLPEPGPGGFRGGSAPCTLQPSTGPGLGPGGALDADVGGSYGSLSVTCGGSTRVLYGNVGVLPVIGGSGGSGGPFRSGGGGGGAMLLAAGDAIAVGGTISANGGTGYNASYDPSTGGSGGGIRLIADTLLGAGALSAQGGVGRCAAGTYVVSGNGRIRIEANQSDWSFTSNPAYTFDLPGAEPTIWLPEDKPSVRMVSLGGVSLPADPRGGITLDQSDAYLGGAGAKTLVIEARNVPLTWKVRARVAPVNTRPATLVEAAYDSGTEALSVWKAELTIGQYYTAIQVRASEN